MAQAHIKIIFGAIALATSLGVAQLAVGGDLAELRGSQGGAAAMTDARASTAPDAVAINRDAKSDRAAVPAVSPSRTISVRMTDQADSSFLVRIPSPSGDARRAPAPSLRGPAGKAMVACEPVVSVLTDIAKQLQPGRCVT